MVRVLVADDHAMFREMLRIALPRRHGGSGLGQSTADASHLADTPSRARPSRVPVIAITAHAMRGYRERCIAAGMDEYIAKPIHLKRLCP
jgi:CheY-like chemotaxis protein